jgi:transcriptional regulator with XRE-family HTH domain
MGIEVRQMKEINIAKVLVNKRKEKGVTQDELANYMGVSKASVSKWETGQSYPDITFLPVLASYFNLSIDELIDYQPQMTKEDIRRLYLKLSADFSSRPFDDVMQECRETIKKYYACFPLLLQMGTLIMNHAELVKDREQALSVVNEAKELFIRVRTESGEVSLIKQALFLEALCSLYAGQAYTVVDLLEGEVSMWMPPETLLASAYQMLGRAGDAKSVLQAGMYQDLVVLFNFFPSYLILCADDSDKFDEALRRAIATADSFDLKRLHPGVLVGLYIAAAQGYLMQQNRDRAIDMLREYTDIVTGDIYPLRLHGDGFFDLLEGWLKDLDLGSALPRNEKTIRKSMADAIVQNPAFSALAEDPRFQAISEKLQNNAAASE